MFDLSIGSLYFAIFLILGPVLLRNNFKYRNIVFLLMNLLVFIGGSKGVIQLIVAAAWVSIPFLFMRVFPRTKGVAIIVLVCIFMYLMKYDACV